MDLNIHQKVTLKKQLKKIIYFSFKKQSIKVEKQFKIRRSIYWQSTQCQYDTCYVVTIKNKRIALLFCNPSQGEDYNKISPKSIKFDAKASNIINSI